MTIKFPEDKTVLISGQCHAGNISADLHSAFWLGGRGIEDTDCAATHLLNSAHDSFAQLAAVMGYTIAPIDAEPVAVNPLVWVAEEQDRGDGYTDLTGDHSARSVVGEYTTDLSFGSDAYYWSVARDGEEIGHSYEDLAFAQAAAQADYEARIRSGLAAAKAVSE